MSLRLGDGLNSKDHEEEEGWKKRTKIGHLRLSSPLKVRTVSGYTWCWWKDQMLMFKDFIGRGHMIYCFNYI